ncbi:Malonyl-CoA decarboxylase, mitochondrial [Nymphon striatum]|nr:Malonyl-CoA decarboxylase, mitochondrial [Nymphon striatum]
MRSIRFSTIGATIRLFHPNIMSSKFHYFSTNAANKYLDTVFIGAEHGTTTTREASCRELCNHYIELDGEAKVAFLKYLSVNYSASQKDIKAYAKSLLETVDSAKQLHLQEKLREALTPKYVTIFHEIGRFEDGVKFLVDLRTDILISDYEAVHPVRNWTDLKRRVGMYRRCYVFTHNSMPLEPIVVLHTALTDQISDSIQSIVAYQRQHSEGDITLQNKVQQKEDPRKVKAAVFYSITSTQKELHNVMTFEASSKIAHCAEGRKDTDILCNINGVDLIAIEAKYHKSCHVAYCGARSLHKYRSNHTEATRSSYDISSQCLITEIEP